MTKRMFKLTLLIGWMLLIFLFSNDTGEVATKKSDGLIIGTIEFLLERDLTDAEKIKYIDWFVTPVRKGAHLLVYFVLGYLMISTLKEFRLVDKRTYIFAVILCVLYSISDEVHQYLVPGRSAGVIDVLIDTVGSSLGVWNWANKYKLKTRKIELKLLRKRKKVKKQVDSNE